jgi:hypothetical protein
MMKLSIAIDMTGDNSEVEIVARALTRDEASQHKQSFRVSGNFVAQLAATLLDDLDGGSRHREKSDAMQRYEVASAPGSCPPGTVMCRKI